MLANYTDQIQQHIPTPSTRRNNKIIAHQSTQTANKNSTYLSSKHPQHILHNRPNIIRLPCLTFIRMLQMRHNIHNCLQTLCQYLLLIFEFRNEIIHVGDGTFGFDASVGLVEDGGDFFFGHDEIERGSGWLLFVVRVNGERESVEYGNIMLVSETLNELNTCVKDGAI
jgi:hypothetical protein